MNSIKCKNCGLSNFSSADECARCGYAFSDAKRGKTRPDGKRPSSFSVASLFVYAALAVGGYYLYSGIYKSVEAVDAAAAQRVAAQPPQKAPPPGLSRNEADRQHSAQVGTAIKENPSFAAQKRHDEETQKLIQESSR